MASAAVVEGEVRRNEQVPQEDVELGGQVPRNARRSAPIVIGGFVLAAVAVSTWRYVRPVSAKLEATAHLQEDDYPKFLSVDATLEHLPRVCDEEVVKETCALLNKNTHEYFGTELDTDPSVLHAAEIADALALTKTAIRNLLGFLKVPNLETDEKALEKGAYAVKCQDLCTKLLTSFGDDKIPSHSDVACYIMPKTNQSTCDIDVSPSEIMGIGRAEHAFEHVNASTLRSGMVRRQNTPEESMEDVDRETVSDSTLKILLLEMFRVHPLSEATFDGRIKSDDDKSDSESDPSSPATGRRLNCDGCRWAKDGECDDGTWCHHGTDCTDCGNCNSNDDTCIWAKDGMCDGEEFCKLGTDCTDCKNCDGGKEVVGEVPQGSGETSSVVTRAIQELATGRAWASTAMRQLGRGAATTLLQTWFGNSKSATRQEVRSVAVGALNVLSNCVIQTNEPECSKMPSVLAYVYPGQKNSNGKFIIWMCPYANNFERKEFIGTLYHEAAHHPTANRDDVIYGRSGCKDLARRQPRSAMENSDNHEYFFEDLNN